MAVILIVEDDVLIREIAEPMIEDWGHHTLSASDADEALYTSTFPSTDRRTLYRYLSQNSCPWRV
jgi:CheY-like chemotaxis protein